MKKKSFKSLWLWMMLTAACFPVAAQQTLNVGVIVVKDIYYSDPYLCSKSAVISQDVYYNGKILFAAGTPVIMDIQYQGRHGLGVPATVAVSPISTTDIYGQLWALSSDIRIATGKDRHGAAIGCGVFFGIVAFPVGLLFLCIKGGHAIIPAGTQMVATIQLN